MKHLKLYEEFKYQLILENELKYSKPVHKFMVDKIQILLKQVDRDKEKSIELCKNSIIAISITPEKVDEILFDKFPIRLGYIILNTIVQFASDFHNKIEIDELEYNKKWVIINKMIDIKSIHIPSSDSIYKSFPDLKNNRLEPILMNGTAKIHLVPYWGGEDDYSKRLYTYPQTFEHIDGALGLCHGFLYSSKYKPIKYLFDKTSNNFICSAIAVNLKAFYENSYEHGYQDFYDVSQYDKDDVVRHELQHFTQALNSLCLIVGEKAIKELKNGIGHDTKIPFLDPRLSDIKSKVDKIEEFYNNCVYEAQKSAKVGIGSEKTNLRQQGIGTKISEYNKDIRKTLDKFWKKFYNGDEIDTEEEEKIAAWLTYIGDDKEYKTWLSTIIQKYLKNTYMNSYDIKELAINKKIIDKYESYLKNISKDEDYIFTSEEEEEKNKVLKKILEEPKIIDIVNGIYPDELSNKINKYKGQHWKDQSDSEKSFKNLSDRLSLQYIAKIVGCEYENIIKYLKSFDYENIVKRITQDSIKDSSLKWLTKFNKKASTEVYSIIMKKLKNVKINDKGKVTYEQ
jgi:hypothetical protein